MSISKYTRTLEPTKSASIDYLKITQVPMRHRKQYQRETCSKFINLLLILSTELFLMSTLKAEFLSLVYLEIHDYES
jgi:hypothetical protein